MAAGTCSQAEIARALRMHQKDVWKILQDVDTAKLVDEARKVVRAYTISESLQIAVKGMAWVNETIDNRDSQQFDQVARGLGNLERVWSSASGERAPAPVQVAVINQPAGSDSAAEIARLVELLVPSREPA